MKTKFYKSKVCWALGIVALQLAGWLHAPTDTAAQVIIVTFTPPFPPTIPSIQPDESTVYYHYKMTSDGSFSGDPEYLDQFYALAAEESTSRVKTNGTSAASSRSQLGYAHEFDTWCDTPPDFVSNLIAVCWSDQDTSCAQSVGWYNVGDTVSGPTETTLSCGSVTEGDSFYDVDLNPTGLAGGACGVVPNWHLSGNGKLYEINLTLTQGCTNNTVPPPHYGNLSIGSFAPSTSVFTPTNGSFDGSGSFRFSFPTGGVSPIAVFGSTNLAFWEYVGVVSQSNSVYNFLDTNAPSFSRRFYLVQFGGESCSDAYGFVKVSAPTGYSMIANPLFTRNMRIGNILSNVPNSTTLQYWVGTNWAAPATFSSGAWDYPSWKLTPGIGARIYVPTNTTLTFVGQVLKGTLTNFIPAGMSVVSSIVPQAGAADTLGLTESLTNGDRILKWNGTGFNAYTNVSGTWQPSMPSLSIGESVIAQTGSATNLGRVFQYSDVYSLATPIITMETNNPWNSITGFHLKWDTSLWDGDPRTVAVPEGAVYEVYDYAFQFVFSYPVTEASLAGGAGELYEWDQDHQPTQGDDLRVRYRNGAIYGPFSNAIHVDH